MRLRLLGGLVAFVTTLFCAPLRRTGKGRGRGGGGLYPEFSVLGIFKGCSPGLLGIVARWCALLPSFECARREASRHGAELDIKVVHRIARQAGERMLECRRRGLLAWRRGLLPQGSELAGKRIGVSFDGGRVRLRERCRRQKGKGRNRTRRRSWTPEWREPKVMTIFELDQQGRMKRGSRPWLEATFGDADQAMELLAYHLHRLGAARAEVVAFVADGASCIWKRIPEVLARAGIDRSKTHLILDFYHAAQTLNQALQAADLTEAERRAQFRRLRRMLYKGCPYLLQQELQVLGNRKKLFRRAAAYLIEHAGHMQYNHYRRLGLPMGSGAVESTIRRLVNLRLKGNGLMWLRENAEGMLALRAAVISDRWDETLETVRATMAADRSIGAPSPKVSGGKSPKVCARPPPRIVIAAQGDVAIPA